MRNKSRRSLVNYRTQNATLRGSDVHNVYVGCEAVECRRHRRMRRREKEVGSVPRPQYSACHLYELLEAVFF